MANPTIESLKTENAQLKADNEKLTKLVEELNTANADLTKSLNDLKGEAVAAGLLPSVELKGKTYRFTVPTFYLNEQKFTAEAASKNEAVVKQLIEMNSAILKA
jgi:hypothetical protein